MKHSLKIIVAIILLSASVFATLTARAYWTGKVRYGSSVTGKSIVTCEYDYAGRKFWETFAASTCPNSIEVY